MSKYPHDEVGTLDETISPSAVIGPGHTFATVTDKISNIVLTKHTPRFWYIGAGVAFLLSDDARYLTGHTIALDGGGLAL